MGARRIAVQLAGTAALLAAAGTAQAIDYWRIDFGYSQAMDAKFADKDFAGDQMICGNPSCTTAGSLDEAGKAGIFSAGLGWNLKNNWRFDFTFAYRTGYQLNKTMPDAMTLRADIASYALMGNLYKDFVTEHLKAYIGVGGGAVANKIDTMQASQPNPPGIPPTTFSLPGGTQSTGAFSLMAGVAVPLSGSMTLDIGYRYSDLGRLETNAGTTGGSNPDYSGAMGKLKANEITIGLRF